MSTGNNTANQNMIAYFENIGLGGGPGVGTLLTATAAQINAAAAPASRFVSVPDAASYTILAADSGKTHILPDFTSTCTLTFPAASAGLEYTFIGGGSAADAQNWVFTAPAGAFLRGGVMHADLDSGTGADEIVAVYANGSSHLTLTVTTPAGGTSLYFICDGTKWVMNGTVNSNTAPAAS